MTGVAVLVSHSSSVEVLRHGGGHEEAHGVRPPYGAQGTGVLHMYASWRRWQRGDPAALLIRH
ncbi:hypothetical protein ACIHCQ_43525 [Streptomyces sp. NPDC052236]|uniref:hypothetical protein n=1 Tax=Streptomyces sp. NPDC052236 TaxID=3365686 RepID=UPI0037D16A13